MAEEQGNRMKTIGDLLTRDLSRKIEDIIQVDQADEQSVHDEITEYVATDSIREQYHDLLKAVVEAPSDPHESVGVWVSGFFGSGKSSFANSLGYALENRTVLGSKFANLFKQQLGDIRTSDLLDLYERSTLESMDAANSMSRTLLWQRACGPGGGLPSEPRWLQSDGP